MALPASLRTAAEAWLADDPDPATRAELSSLLEAGDEDAEAERALAARFGLPLTFGTAGLRGPLQAGPSGLNLVWVRRLAAGLARHLPEADRADGVVVGYDARHRSADFAREAAAVLAAAGVRARLLPRALPTPVAAFAVRHLGAAGGLVVTASHNPAADNGVKVYVRGGRQLTSPEDAALAAAMDAVGPVREVPLAPERVEALGEDVLAAYLGAVVALPGASVADGPAGLRVVATAMHGVGGDVLEAAMRRAGFAPPVHVERQWSPDPDFPTAAFPNPEEPGALDLALAEAAAERADLVVALDPDADRLALCVPTDAARSEWRRLTGDEVGALLGEHVLAVTAGRPDRVVASTIVSSQLLGRIAAAAGVEHVETLTGFKWLSRAADGHPGGELVFAYEEALGYLVGGSVADKDGISAALVACGLAEEARREGRGLLDRLDDLARRHGLHVTRPWSLRVEGLGGRERLSAAVAAVRAAPPAALGPRAVVRVEDLASPGARPGLPAADVVLLHLEGGARVALRPSGTEPKLKAYAEVVVPVGEGTDLAEARRRADAELDAVLGALEVMIST